MKGGISMDDNSCSFIEKIGGVTFIVKAKPAEKAKLSADDFIKAVIAKECLALEDECA